MKNLLQERLKELRRNKKLSQLDIANLLQITSSAYGFYEQGKSIPSAETLSVLSDFYGVSADYILGRTSDPFLTTKDEKDIGKKIAKIQHDLASADTLMMYGDVLTDDDKEKLQQALEIVITLSKKEAKEKFNPNKNGQK